MSSTIIHPSQFDVSGLEYSEPKTLSSGGKSVYIKYKSPSLPKDATGNIFRIETPLMVTQFGLSQYNPNGDNSAAKYSVELSFRNRNKKRTGDFFKMMSALDKTFVDDGITNSTLWFKKKYGEKDRNVVEALYSSLVKYPRDKETSEITDKYPPTFRVSIPKVDGVITCPVYDQDQKEVTISDIEKGSKVQAILQCSGLWLAGGKYGCSWKVVQLRVVPKTDMLKGCAFTDYGDDDNEGDNDIEEKDAEDVEQDADMEEPEPELVDETEQVVASTPPEEPELIQSSDEEEPPPPPKRVVKKTIVKK